MKKQRKKVTPRNDYVLLRGIVKKSKVITLEAAKESMVKSYVVEALGKGEGMDDLKVGDKAILSPDIRDVKVLYKEGEDIMFMVPQYYIIGIES